MNYYANTNRLKSVADGMGGTGDNRNMGDVANFVYDSEGNLTEDKSKQMKIAYDWRGMPVEFVRRAGNGDSLKLAMLYDGGGRRFSKTRLRKGTGAADWSVEHVTHYTGIGTEVREYMPWNFVRFTDSQGVEHCISANPDYAGTASTTCPLPDTVRVVVPLPNGLGRHALQDAAYEEPLLQGAYEFYLKDHLGSARVVYGVGFPDPLATRDVEGAPGKAFGVDGNEHGVHLVEAYSSGVNLSGINLLDSASLNSAVAAVVNGRAYDGVRNHHAMRDANPTHLWEMNVDQDGRRAFAVKDGEGRVIASGSLDSTGKLLARSINELDARGNIVKSHPPVSCGYTPRPANCVAPSEYGYDAQSQMVWSREPDAGETRTFYDLTGRVRATQTQRQIDSGAYSVVGYDHLDRIIYTGEWRPAFDSGAARVYFNDVQNRNSPSVAELTPGTVTRTFYDRMPAMDTLGVSLYPADIPASAFGFTRNRVAAVVSDVFADGSGNVVRVSTANSYDKYGRVLASYTFDPTMPADSLKMLAVISEYDLGGKVTKVTKYPYGVAVGGVDRRIGERYTYDRLGRVDSILSKNGESSETMLARYEYYPTGSVKRVTLGNSIALDYTYHISGAVKTAVAKNLADNSTLYSETLYYEDCGTAGCTPQYNGNISRMAHEMAVEGGKKRTSDYVYDFMNRLTDVDDSEQDEFDEYFAYDAQGRITAQRRGANVNNKSGGEYVYYSGTNKLKSVANGMGGTTADKRDMSASDNFEYDADGNMTNDNSKDLTIAYDWRGMPVEFKRFRCTTKGSTVCDSVKLVMAYDGSGRRISKTRLRRDLGASDWAVENVTHYTGIGTEVRETHVNGQEETKVVVNLPEGLGRYTPEDAEKTALSTATLDENGRPTSWSVFNPKFEWYLKNYLGSTMLVYGTGSDASANGVKAAYDYRAFGERVDYTVPTDKITETFTGKELDDETQLSNHGARMLDPMLGMWISVDPKRFFPSPYLYMGNGYNPIRFSDLNGERPGEHFNTPNQAAEDCLRYYSSMSNKKDVEYFVFVWKLEDGKYATNTQMFEGTVDAFGEKEIRNALEIGVPMGHKNAVAGAHLHGGENSEYDSERFSEQDYSGFVEPLGIDLYLMTPEETFQRMDPGGNVEFLEEMPEVDVK